ncbi:phospholipase A1 1-like [Macrosteles quadrilineatus]|uniref:phospholipase A1 1-like n=1 Tax=Macrosteles quadrilineatus TaxID=74068 RepID=UPI0023E24F90|nr:phospholipase A1 1-like [Macrosteles quadrilineatus]
MKQILLLLIFINLQGLNVEAYDWRTSYTKWKNAFKWSNPLLTPKSVSKENIEAKIQLHLLDKQWVPDGTNAVQSDDVIPKYRGTVKDAFKIFTSKELQLKYLSSPLAEAKELLKEENGYKVEQESIFIIHTVNGSPNDDFVKNSITALVLRNFLKKYNVFAFDLKELNDYIKQTIFEVMLGRRLNYEALSEVLGNFFNSAIADNLIEIDKIHLVGFCFSAQLSGYIGRYVSSKNDGKKMKSITALDPYSTTLFSIKNKNSVISKNDAELVFVFHTGSFYGGTFDRKATADFVINNGGFQPGCFFSRKMFCSHKRSVPLFWYIILYPELWTARKCSSYLLFSSCLCSFKEKTSLTFPPVPGAQGTYYLNTMAHKPYGFGPKGANCISFFKGKKADDIVKSVKLANLNV